MLPDPQLTQPVWRRKPRAAGVVVLAVGWFFAARLVADRSASGLTLRFGESSLQPLVMAAFLLFLLVVGLLLVATAVRNGTGFLDVAGLPRRSSARREWTLGTALGWGAAIVVLSPLVLGQYLQTRLWLAPRAFWLAAVGLLAMMMSSLSEELVFRGYAYRRLIASTGPVRATLVMSTLYALTYVLLFDATWMNFVIAALLGMLLSTAWLRTHGLWLSWGIHFAWKASLAILFGLPVSGSSVLSSIVNSQAFGPASFAGTSSGPEASSMAVVALLIAYAVLFPLTRDYAWDYTHSPITPGGYPVDVPPPSAHSDMERGPAPPPPLVQILPSTSQNRSVMDPPA